MTVSVDSTAAGFLPMREFHRAVLPARASLATGYPRQGGGSQIDCGVHVPVVDHAAGLAGPLHAARGMPDAGADEPAGVGVAQQGHVVLPGVVGVHGRPMARILARPAPACQNPRVVGKDDPCSGPWARSVVYDVWLAVPDKVRTCGGPVRKWLDVHGMPEAQGIVRREAGGRTSCVARGRGREDFRGFRYGP